MTVFHLECLQVYLWDKFSEVRLLGQNLLCIFNFEKCCPIALHKGGPTLHIQDECRRINVSMPYPHSVCSNT